MEKRVVITGQGIISPIGNNIAEYWDGLKNGRCGIEKLEEFQEYDLSVKGAARVKNFNPLDYGMNAGEKRRYGETLLKIAEDSCAVPSRMITGFSEGKKDLKERLIQIMSFKKKSKAQIIGVCTDNPLNISFVSKQIT